MTLNLDATNTNADWIKLGAWDIPATTADELRAYLNDRGITVADFKSLPVYTLNQHKISWLAAFDQPLPDPKEAA